MTYVWPVLYVLAFLILYTLAAGTLEISGISAAITKLALTGQRVPYSRALEWYNLVTEVLGLIIAFCATLATWSIRHPGGVRSKVNRIVNSTKAPSVRVLVAWWVIAPFTLGLGYIAAIYSSWRFATGHRNGRAPSDPAQQAPAQADALASRLAQLDAARDAGLITNQEHADKRAAAVQAF